MPANAFVFHFSIISSRSLKINLFYHHQLQPHLSCLVFSWDFENQEGGFLMSWDGPDWWLGWIGGVNRSDIVFEWELIGDLGGIAKNPLNFKTPALFRTITNRWSSHTTQKKLGETTNNYWPTIRNTNSHSPGQRKKNHFLAFNQFQFQESRTTNWITQDAILFNVAFYCSFSFEINVTSLIIS